MKDLLVVVADGEMEKVMNILLGERYRSIGIRAIDFSVLQSSGKALRDSGMRAYLTRYLRDGIGEFKNYRVLLAVFDYDGSGENQLLPQELEEKMENDIVRDQLLPWGPGQVCVVAVDPELEAWVWNDSNETARILGFKEYSQLRSWAARRGFWARDSSKPLKPKDLFDKIREVRFAKKGRGRRLDVLKEIAKRTSADPRRCRDRAYRKMCEFLQKHFGL